MGMRTCSGKVYHPDKSDIDMDLNASLSDITLLTYYLILEIIKTLEEIKDQMNTLGQRMDKIEVKRRDRGVMKTVNSTNAERIKST